MASNIFRLFIAVLIFSPLAFGTVEQWSLSVMEASSFLAVALLFLRNIRRKKTFVYEVPGLLPLALFLLYLIFQVIPLPPEILRFLSPGTYSLYAETVWTVSPSAWASVSIHKKATLLEFFRLSSYAAFYFLTVQLLTKKDIMRKAIVAVSVFAASLSFISIVQQVFSNNRIFWIRELTQGGTPFGPFVNRNHYAGFMGMIFPLLLSLFLYYKPDVQYGSLRERIVEFINHRRSDVHILFGLAAILGGVSVFLCLSRSGITSLCLSLIFLGALLVGKGKKKGILIILVVVILYAVGWFGWKPIFERFERVRDVSGDISDIRPEIWRDSMSIIKDFPLTGAGFGTYGSIYPRYRSISAEGIVEHAHNDYLELLTDGGLIAVLLFTWFLITVLFKSYKVFLTRRDNYSIYVFIGVITGIVSILVHGITDFNLHIGSNGLYFFFLAGLAVSAANTRVHGEGDTFLRKIQCPWMKQSGIIPVFIFFISLVFNIGILAGQFYSDSAVDVRQGASVAPEDLSRTLNSSHKASLFDPLEARYWYSRAGAEWLSSRRSESVGHYLKAVELDTANAEYLQSMGYAMSNLKKPDVADRLLRAGIAFDVRNPAPYKRYGFWLMEQGDRENGIRNIRSAISLDPKKTREYISLLVLYGLSDGEIVGALPERAEPHLIFADYLFKTGNDVLADDEYRKALYLTKDEKEVTPSLFYPIYQYYVKRKMFDDALLVMKAGEELLPGNVGLILGAAEAYERVGITYRAVEEYRKALIIDPENKRARKKLEELQ